MPPIPQPDPSADKSPVPATSPETATEMAGAGTTLPTAESPVSNVDKEAFEVKAMSGDEDSLSSAPSLNDQHSEFQQRMNEKREIVEEQKRRLTASYGLFYVQSVYKTESNWTMLIDLGAPCILSIGLHSVLWRLDSTQNRASCFWRRWSHRKIRNIRGCTMCSRNLPPGTVRRH